MPLSPCKVQRACWAVIVPSESDCGLSRCATAACCELATSALPVGTCPASAAALEHRPRLSLEVEARPVLVCC